jgi:NAD(P)-dependent dehydrogenase (short-subunit alcohol dehydrogenase family)
MEMKRFVGQVIVITGAARGIGKACAERFAEEGAKIAFLDVIDDQNRAAAEAVGNKFGTETFAVHCDVTDGTCVKEAFDQVIDRWGQIDTLVCSAGITTSTPLPEIELSEWQRTITINLTGTFLCNQAVAPVMMKQKSGSIINLASMAGKTSWPWTESYSASKSGVIGLTRSVAMELAEYGVTVNALCPGNTLTEMVRKVAEDVGGREGITSDEWLQGRANDCPMKRLAEPWEMAGVVAFLASKDSRYLTGQAIEVDGGMVMS